MEYGEHQVRDASTRAPSRCGTDYASFASAGSFDSFPWNEEELKQVKSHDVKVLEAFRYKIQKRVEHEKMAVMDDMEERERRRDREIKAARKVEAEQRAARMQWAVPALVVAVLAVVACANQLGWF